MVPLADIDRIVPSLECSNCGKKLGKTYGWLKTHDHFICNCGARNTWNPEQFSEIVKTITKDRAQMIKKIRRSLKG